MEKISAKLTRDKPKQRPNIPPTFAIRVVKVDHHLEKVASVQLAPVQLVTVQ